MAQAQQAGQPNRAQPKKQGLNKQAHTPNTKFGMGDFYGQAVKNKVGKVIRGMGEGVSKKKLGTPPKSLA